MKQFKFLHGFTLIELMVVMAILAILMAIGIGTFSSSQRKGRDSARKAHLKAISGALELYYNDKGQYPYDDGHGGIRGCGVDDISPCTWGGPFQDKNNTVYMQQLPTDPTPNQSYYYHFVANNMYQIYAHLENTQDAGIISTGFYCDTGANQLRCNYGVSSPNTNP